MIDPNGLSNEVFQDAHLTAPDLPFESSSVLEHIAQMSFSRIEDVHDILNFLSNIPYDPSAGDVKQHKTLEEAQAYAFANITLRILSEYQANNDASKFYLDGHVKVQTVNADGDVIDYYEFVGDTEEYNDYVNSFYNQQSSGGNERSGLDNANLIVGATGVAQGAQENIIALDKSLNNLKYTKWLKIAGRSLFGIQAGISLYNAGEAIYTNDKNKWGVVGKSTLDIAIGAFAVWGGPAGWIVGGVYFIGDAAGWWGDWGKPADD